MHTIRHLSPARSPITDEWRLVYEWFAGWRWEQHCGGKLVDECLMSFETEEECRSDVNRHRLGSDAEAARGPAIAQDDLTRLAA